MLTGLCLLSIWINNKTKVNSSIVYLNIHFIPSNDLFIIHIQFLFNLKQIWKIVRKHI